MSDKPRKDHSIGDVLEELFPKTYRELFGTEAAPLNPTIGLYQVADQRMALVKGDQLAELTPIEPKGKSALLCDLCHYTRSRSEANMYRVTIAPQRTRYVTLCCNTAACQHRAGRQGLEDLIERIFPAEVPATKSDS